MSRTVSELARMLNLRNIKKRALPALLLMTDSKRLPDPSPLIPHLPKNSAVIIRGFSRDEKVTLIKHNKRLCQKHKVKLLVSDDLKLALQHRLDGVHFSQKNIYKSAGCGYLPKSKPHFIYTGACHDIVALNNARKAKVDAVVISPVFATKSHVGTKPLGVSRLNKLVKDSQLPTYALGGISEKTAIFLRSSPLVGFAGVGSII